MTVPKVAFGTSIQTIAIDRMTTFIEIAVYCTVYNYAYTVYILLLLLIIVQHLFKKFKIIPCICNINE